MSICLLLMEIMKMKRMNKRIVSLIAVCLICLGVSAQEFNRYEVSVNLGGGVSGFQTQPTEGKASPGWSATLGAGYHLFFNPQWGIGTGLNFAVYNGGISITDYATQQTTTNLLTGHELDFKMTIPNYKETHQAIMATIPLMLQFQSTGKTIFYASLGGKAGLPLLSNNLAKGRITSTGYYPALDVTYVDLPEYGLVTSQPFPKSKSDIELKPAFMASAEVGIKKLLVNKMSLYLGLFFDYGLNDVLKKQEVSGGFSSLVVYLPHDPANFAYNTALNNYSTQMKPFAIGFKARLTVAKKTWDKSYFKFREEK